MAKRGRLIVISAPSGCGKTTIAKRLLERNRNLLRSVSYTTRSPRTGEENGRDYHFISKPEFLRKKRVGFFIESAEVFGRFYGTSKGWIRKQLLGGRNVLLTIDVQGMKQLRTKMRQGIRMVSIFIMPPSVRVLKSRLAKRQTESKAEIQKRLKLAEGEMAARDLYDFTVVNRKIDQAIREIEDITKL